jgi:hypothetical protein
MELEVEVALNREASLRFQLFEPGQRPIDIAQIRRRPRRIELSIVYAFGR